MSDISRGDYEALIYLRISKQKFVPLASFQARFSDRAASLKDYGFVEVRHRPVAVGTDALGFKDYIRITSKGEDAILAFEDCEKKKAEDERKEATKQQTEDKRYRKDARRSWWQLGIEIAVSLFTFFLGAYLAGQTTALDWFLHIFR